MGVQPSPAAARPARGAARARGPGGSRPGAAPAARVRPRPARAWPRRGERRAAHDPDAARGARPKGAGTATAGGRLTRDAGGAAPGGGPTVARGQARLAAGLAGAAAVPRKCSRRRSCPHVFRTATARFECTSSGWQ